MTQFPCSFDPPRATAAAAPRRHRSARTVAASWRRVHLVRMQLARGEYDIAARLDAVVEALLAELTPRSFRARRGA